MTHVVVDWVWCCAARACLAWCGRVATAARSACGRVAGELGRALRASGESRSGARRLPAVRQQFVNSTVQLRGQPGEHILEVGPRISPIELGRLRRAPNYAECFSKVTCPAAFTTCERVSIQIWSA